MQAPVKSRPRVRSPGRGTVNRLHLAANARAYAGVMARPPDDPKINAERVAALLARWQTSLELHTRYLALDDARYWHVQPWPPHERPAAWIVQLARQKVAELARALAERCVRGDFAFAVGLEQMLFLANLVGLQPAGRHLPLADPQNEQADVLPRPDPGTADTRRPRTARHSGRARGMRAPPAASRAGRNSVPDNSSEALPPLSAAARPVVEDAVRLLQWGRKWHELGELIARLPQRPTVGDTRRILRTHRARIEAAAADSAGAHQ